jgi:hypothetical protein
MHIEKNENRWREAYVRRDYAWMSPMLKSIEERGRGSALTWVTYWFAQHLLTKHLTSPTIADLKSLTEMRNADTGREQLGEASEKAWNRAPFHPENRALSRLYEGVAGEFFNYPSGYYFYTGGCIEVIATGEGRPELFFTQLFRSYEEHVVLCENDMKIRLDQILNTSR